MDGIKNGHYFPDQNQSNGTDSAYGRNPTSALNYPSGFNVGNLMVPPNMQNNQAMQNSQAMQNQQGIPNIQNYSGLAGIPNLQGLTNFQNMQQMSNMQGGADMHARANAMATQRTQNTPNYPGMANAGAMSSMIAGQNLMQGIQAHQQPPGYADSQLPGDEHNLNYYHEYCRLYIANVVLNTQMNELKDEKDELMVKLEQLEKRRDELQRSQSDYNPLEEKKKRFRRTAGEIERHYRCPIMSCQKSYGSEGSLNQHLKLKHPEYEIPASMAEGTGSVDDEGN